jgi:tryptophan 2,3-dioxygenase
LLQKHSLAMHLLGAIMPVASSAAAVLTCCNPALYVSLSSNLTPASGLQSVYKNIL